MLVTHGHTHHASLTLKQDVAGSVHDDSKILYDYKGRPRMVSSQQGMVAADQGDCSAMGTPHTLCMHVRVAALCRTSAPACSSAVCPANMSSYIMSRALRPVGSVLNTLALM